MISISNRIQTGRISAILSGPAYISYMTQLSDDEFPRITVVRDNEKPAEYTASAINQYQQIAYSDETRSIITDPTCTQLRPYAFYGCDKLTEVNYSILSVIPTGLFQNCTHLSKINLGECREIGSSAFYGCQFSSFTANACTTLKDAVFKDVTTLTSVAFNDVTTIGNETFMGCTGLVDGLIFSSCTTIGQNAFRNCENITSITISSGCDIGAYAFVGCNSMQDTWQNNHLFRDAGNIGRGAFYNVKNSLFSNITLSNVTYIGSEAFYNCNTLESVNIASPGSNIIIEESAFAYCTGLKSFKTSSVFSGNSSEPTNAEVTVIRKHAFLGCTNMSKFDFPLVTTISQEAFRGCTHESFTSIDLPAVTDTGASIFMGCTNLKTVTMSGASKIDWRTFRDLKNLEQINIPNVTVIGQEAFYGCTSLTTINTASKITTIGSYAFQGCSLITYSLPTFNMVHTIYNNAFRNCEDAIKRLNPSYWTNLTSIGDYAFANCNVAVIDLPNCSFIGNYAFVSYTGGDFISENTLLGYSISTPTGWISSQPCLSIGNKVSSYITIGSNAFAHCKNIQSLDTSSHYIHIGSRAFYECVGLKDVDNHTINAIRINQHAFEGCIGLNIKSIIFSNTTNAVIELNAFDGCVGLTNNLTISNVYEIQANAFAGCTGLANGGGRLIIQKESGSIYISKLIFGEDRILSINDSGDVSSSQSNWIQLPANCTIHWTERSQAVGGSGGEQ